MKKKLTLKDYLTILWKRKIILTISTLSCLIIGVISAVVYRSNISTISTVVEVNWSGVDRGEYPNGNSIDYSNIFSSEAIKQAVDELEFDLSASKVKSKIKTSGIVPNDVTALIETALKNGEKITYFPTDISVTMDNKALGLNFDDASLLLETIINKESEEFRKKYISRNAVFSFSNLSLEQYDYAEISKMASYQIEIYETAIYNVLPNANTFISSELGLGFNHYLLLLTTIKEIQLNSYETKVTNYLLSKDPDMLILKYRYSIEQKQLQVDKNTSLLLTLEELINNYKGSTATIIIPGVDPSVILEIETALTAMYNQKILLEKETSTLREDIIYLERQIDRIEGNDPEYVFSPEEIERVTKMAEDEMKEILSRLDVIADDLEILLTEYNDYLIRGIFRLLSVPQKDSTIGLTIFIGISAIVGVSLGIIIIFFVDYFSRKNDEEVVNTEAVQK